MLTTQEVYGCWFIRRVEKQQLEREQESERETERESKKDQREGGRERERERGRASGWEQIGAESVEGKIGNRRGAKRQREEQLENHWTEEAGVRILSPWSNKSIFTSKEGQIGGRGR